MTAPTATCAICFDELPPRAFITLCGANHQFCVDCAWPSCKAMLEEGLVPACPHDREQKCGAVPKAAAEEALKRWLKQEDTEARKAQLDSWSIKGLTSGKLSGVYLSAERAAQGAVQCIKCKLFHVPVVPHSQEPQRVVCTGKRCGASFCAACRHPYHFRTTCAEALRVNARWLRFLQGELGPFLMAAVRVDPERYGAILKAHTKSKVRAGCSPLTIRSRHTHSCSPLVVLATPTG